MGNPNPLKQYQFKKGQSGNPNGRPKKLPDLEKLLIEILGEKRDDKTALETILRNLRTKAFRGNEAAANILLNRAYGSPKQKTELTAGEGESLTVIFNSNPRRREDPDDNPAAETEPVS